MRAPDQLSISESSDDGTSAEASKTSTEPSSLLPTMQNHRYDNYGEWAKYGTYGKYGKHGIYGTYGKYGDYGRYGEYGRIFMEKERQGNTNEKAPTFDEYAAAMQQLYEYSALDFTDNKPTANVQQTPTYETIPGWPYPENQQPAADKRHGSKPGRKSKTKASAKGQRATKKRSKNRKRGARTVITKTYVVQKKPFGHSGGHV